MALSRAMSSGVSGLKAFQTAMDVIGNNIANVNTYGFKASSATFSDTMYQVLQAASGSNTNGAAGTNPTQVGYGSQVSRIAVDASPSGMVSTGSPLDCYISGEGYFVVAPQGSDVTGSAAPTGVEYTRVGQLSFDSAGYLTDGKNRILGTCPSTIAPGGATGLSTSISTPGYIQYEPQTDLLESGGGKPLPC